MIKVVPAIIPHNKEQLEGEIKKVSSFANLVQIDISDGIFTGVKTWPYNGRDTDFFEKLRKEEEGWPDWEEVDFEIHLMVRNPEEVVLDWIHTGASVIVIHIESTENIQKIIDICNENFVSVGIAIKPSTDFSLLSKFISEVDFVQVMGSDALGRHGVELDLRVISKIKSLRNENPELVIAIDIGVTDDTAPVLIEAGINKLVSGGEILNADNPEEVYSELSNLG